MASRDKVMRDLLGISRNTARNPATSGYLENFITRKTLEATQKRDKKNRGLLAPYSREPQYCPE
jgi:hypothetical protein